MRINLSEQSIDAIAEIISGGSAGSLEPSIGLYRQGWRLAAWFKGFGVPYDLSREAPYGAERTIHRACAVGSSDRLCIQVLSEHPGAGLADD